MPNQNHGRKGRYQGFFSLLEKSNVPESIDEDISKTTDVDLNSDGKKDNDTSAKDGTPKVEEKVNKSSGIDEDEVVTPAEDAKEEEEEESPLTCQKEV